MLRGMSDKPIPLNSPLLDPVSIPVNPSVEKIIGMRQADRLMKAAGYSKLKAPRLRARAWVGKFIAQEGEHHIGRSSIAATMEDLEDLKLLCEDKLAKATAAGDEKGQAQWIETSLAVARQMTLAAKELNMTRNKALADDGAGAPKVPTMPARTVITNNTQYIVHPPKED